MKFVLNANAFVIGTLPYTAVSRLGLKIVVTL